MTFKTTVRLDSKIFNRDEIKRLAGTVAYESAKDFAKDLQNKMEHSPHTGDVVTKARGANFRVRHQQSRRGERPSPFTRVLLGSIKARKNGDSSFVDSDAPYADKLIFDDGRVIVADEDLKIAEVNQTTKFNAEILKLLR